MNITIRKINLLNSARLTALCMAMVLFVSPAFATTTHSATAAGKHAIEKTDGTSATYSDIIVTKTGDASGSSDDYDWYGGNAAILASGKSTITITSADISSNASYGNAVFAYGGNISSNSDSGGSSGGGDSGSGGAPGDGGSGGAPGGGSGGEGSAGSVKTSASSSGDGTAITISNSTITTSKNNSGGIMVTGGGVINATNLTITTAGGSSAAIRSDKGGGTITATGGTYTANGSGSPAIYSTADITVSNATLKSGVAQGIVIEGGNSVTLNSCTVNANNTKLNSDNDKSYQGVLIYQSMSGDASDGSSTFTMSKGSFTNANGDVFFITNTTCTIELTGVTITNNDTANSGIFLRAATGSWGTSGSNGGNVTLNASGQTITGDIYVDSISTLALNLKDSSTFTGAFTNSSPKSLAVTIESGSTWNLTGNSYVTSLTNSGTINKGSYTLYVNGEESSEGTTNDGTGNNGTGNEGTGNNGTNDSVEYDTTTGAVSIDINGGLTVSADEDGEVTTLPSGSLESAIRNASGLSPEIFYSSILGKIISNVKEMKNVSTNSTTAATEITATLDSALPYGTILLLALTDDDGYTDYAAMIHSGKAGESSTQLVIDTSKLYDPEDTSIRVTFPAGTYTVVFSTLNVEADQITNYDSDNNTEFTLKAAATTGQYGNLGEIALASTEDSSSKSSSSGCNSGMAALMLIPALAFSVRKLRSKMY